MMIEITIKGLPKTPNHRMHWTVRMRQTKQWRAIAKFTALAGKRPENPLTSVKLTLIRGSSKQCDIDNHVASFKPIIDGLKDAKIIADDNPGVVKTIQTEWIKTAPRAGFVKVIVEEI